MTSARAYWPHLAHALLVAALFGPTLFLGEVPFFRDVTYVYYPDFVFLEQSLRAGVFPLWHPGADGGAPFFAPYPPHVALVLLFGAAWTLRLSVALHVLLAMCGTSALARQVSGAGRAGAFVAGAAFGLSGVVLSSLLYPVFLAAAWAPWVVLAWVRLAERPELRRAATLAAVAAVQLATFGGEVCAQTALLAVVLRPPRQAMLRGLAATAALFAPLAAPVLLGARALLADTARAAGFSAAEALAYSAPKELLLESLWPGFFGDLRGFSGLQFWGASLHPNGFPLFLSLYEGPLVLLLAAFGRPRRLFALCALALLLAAGAHGPAAPLLAQATMFRAPVKFMFLFALAVALLAGAGLERARGRVPGIVAVALAIACATAGAAAYVDAGTLAAALTPAFPGLAAAHAPAVLAAHWPPQLWRVAGLLLVAGLGLAAGRAWVAPLALAAELLAANAGLVPSTPASVFTLRPQVRALLAPVERGPRGRIFSCGLCATPPLHWRGSLPGGGRDTALYALERQALAPRTHVLDGLEGAFDEDRAGVAPAASTLPSALRDPARLRGFSRTLALSNVRWLLSWHPLPADLASPRGEAAFPELAETLKLFELHGALPRAYWVPRAQPAVDRRQALAALRNVDTAAVVVVEAAAATLPPAALAGGPAEVDYELLGPHEVRVRARTPPGFVVMLDGFGSGWELVAEGATRPLWRANGRHRAWWTPGGEREFVLRYAPAWRAPAAVSLAAGVFGVLLGLRRRKLDTSRVDA